MSSDRRCASPANPLTIEITPWDRRIKNPPHRPSLEVLFTAPIQADEVFDEDTEDLKSEPFRPRFNSSGAKPRLPQTPEEPPEHGFKAQLGSLKHKLMDLSPKLRHRRKSPQMMSTSDVSDSETITRSRKQAYRLSMQSYMFPKSMDDSDDNYYSENEKYNKLVRSQRHSMGNLMKDGQPEKLTRKTGLMSSVKSLFNLSKTDKPELTLPPAKHIRQSSDSQLLDMSMYAQAEENGRDAAIGRRVSKAHKRSKTTIFVDTCERESAGILCLIPPSLVVNHHPDFEVQRLELSEVAAGISRLKHAESDDHITEMDDQSTLCRIEKLFPNDDLELISSPDGKKPCRRRSAPSQILLKNFRRSTTVVDVGNNKISQEPSTSTADYISRKFIFESPVQLTAGVQTQDRYLFLFNDLLFIAKQRSSTSYKLKNRVLVSDLWIGESIAEVSEVGNLHPTKSFVIGWPTTNYIATFTSKELRDRWEDKLRTQINEEQSKETATSADVEVANSSAGHVTKTVTVNKTADARELLQLTMDTFQIQTGAVTDYQLWVLSTKDDSVYPLFGHEQPFAIQLSHDRDADELDPNIKCQFILRENKKQTKLERKPQKSKKKKLPFIFRKTSNKLASSPRSNSISEGKIFGHPLDQICDPDIPSPLMELLENLYNYGPYTTEIFRKPSNAKRCQEMVAFMNSTEPEGWCEGCHNGILYASILKTFLRELPGKLCCSEYYNQWSNAINLNQDEDKIKVLQKIIEKLPKGNQLFLRYIICILCHIAERSDDNLMTSYNLAVCLGPSLLWNESMEMSEQEASSKIVPLVVQFLIDQCQSIFGTDVLNIFGHPPIAPPDSDTEEVGVTDTINTRYNDSLESLSDTEAPGMGVLTQMSPSSCSRDSGLILSDPHEDAGDHSDDHSLRQQIMKSKSCDSLNRSANKSRHTALPLQTQVSSDSLDCDDEYVELGNDYNYLLTKSRSGGHLYFDKEADAPPLQHNQKIGEKLRTRLATVASRYAADKRPSTLQEVGYSSSDSDKSVSNTPKNEWPSSELLQKSSTSSSLQQGSSSSDDALATDVVTHRHINSPRILESESGHHPTDFLHQFKTRIQTEEEQKKKLRELVRIRTDPNIAAPGTTDTDDEVDSSRRQTGSRHHKHSSGTPRITRTNTYAGKTDRKQRSPADVSMGGNMAEMRPIMPQQYRPNRPPPYREAIERKEQNKTTAVPEIERIRQTVNSARAKQLYAKSVEIYKQESNQSSRSSSRAASEFDSHSTRSTPVTSLNSHVTDIVDNNNTIGIVNTNDKKIVIRRASSAKTPRHKINKDHSSIFYQPGSAGGHIISKPTTILSTSKAANQTDSLFYRPTQPPPYTEALKQRPIKPDLIDSLGGESLV